MNKEVQYLSLSRLFLSQSSMRAAGIFTNAKPCEDTGSRVRLQTHLPFDLVSPRILKSLYEFVIHTAPWSSRDSHSGRSVFQRARAMLRFRAPSIAFRRALSDAVHAPVRAGNAPIKFDAVKDKPYSWCTCGLSKNQPLCDGSHKGTGLKSLKVVPTESNPIMLCTCKLTKNTDGRCDGSHKIPVT